MPCYAQRLGTAWLIRSGPECHQDPDGYDKTVVVEMVDFDVCELKGVTVKWSREERREAYEVLRSLGFEEAIERRIRDGREQIKRIRLQRRRAV